MKFLNFDFWFFSSRPTSHEFGIQITTKDDSNVPHLTHINDNITVKDIALLSVFEVVIPSLDQGTDYYTAATLIHYGSDHWCKTSISDYCVSPAGVARVAEEDLRVRRYGYAMLAPILLMTIFSLRQWWRLEKSRNRLWTLLIVLFQCFPQYRALRILYLGHRKKASWRTEKDVYDSDMTFLGMCVITNYSTCSINQSKWFLNPEFLWTWC